MLQPIHISSGFRMFKRAIKIRSKGYRRYSGSVIEICEQILENCWDSEKKYYRVSTGNYPEFYCRDFGIITDALIELGKKEKVIQTLEYALACFSKSGKITQVISKKGKPYDFPSLSSDALSFLLRSINSANAKGLLEKYREFLNYEIARYYELIFDEKEGMVKKDPHISGMKDYALRISPCYHNCMLAMLSDEIDKARLPNPFKKYDFKKMIKEKFWKKTHFIDDLSGKDTITGDANVFPFWCGIFDEKEMVKSVMKKIKEEGLDYPFPLKYHSNKMEEHKMIWLEFLVNNWERDTVWMHIGLCYLDVVSKYDRLMHEFYLDKIKHVVEMHGNFLELFEPNGKSFKTPFYCADDGMIWSSKLLVHLTKR